MEKKQASLRIFIVDDDELVLKAVAFFLERLGYQTVSFTDSVALRDQVAAGDVPDMVLSDLQMPHINGLELLEELKEKAPGMPFVIMTGTRDLELSVDAVNKGAYGYILKPIVLEKLQAMLERVFREVHLRQQLEEEKQKTLEAQKQADLARVTAGVAHEINNPTTFIRGNVEFAMRLWGRVEASLKTAKSLEEIRPHLVMIEDEMSALFDAMLQGTQRIQMIVQALTAAQSANSNLLSDPVKAWERVREKTAQKLQEIDLLEEIAIEPSQMVAMSEVQCGQIFEHLLGNAVKSILKSHPQKPQIEVGFVVEPEGQALKVFFKDNGGKMDRRLREFIENPQQSNMVLGDETGLSIYLTELLLSRVNGRLSLEDTGAEGNWLTVSLPLANPVAKAPLN